MDEKEYYCEGITLEDYDAHPRPSPLSCLHSANSPCSFKWRYRGRADESERKEEEERERERAERDLFGCT